MGKVISTFYLNMYNGGIQRVVSVLIKKWLQLGYDVILFTDYEESSKDYKYVCDNQKISGHFLGRIILDTYEKKDSRRKEQICSAIKDFKIEYMVYHAWTSPNMPKDREIFTNEGIQFFLYNHSIFSVLYHDRNAYTPFFLEEIKKSELILSISKINHVFFEMIGVKSILIDNPIDEDLLSKEESRLDSNTILWVGRLHEEKRPEAAIYIFNEIQKSFPDAKLQIVGDGVLRKKLEELIRDLGLVEKVSLEGYTEDVERYYRNASLLLCTSKYEGYPMILVESKAYGVPTVMYNMPYLKLLENPMGILTVYQGDVKMAAEKCVYLLQNPQILQQLGKDAKSSLRKIYAGYDDSIWEGLFSNTKREFNQCDATYNEIIEMLIMHEEDGINNEVDKIKNSVTYRIGRIILFIPGMLKKMIKKS